MDKENKKPFADKEWIAYARNYYENNKFSEPISSTIDYHAHPSKSEDIYNSVMKKEGINDSYIVAVMNYKAPQNGEDGDGDEDEKLKFRCTCGIKCNHMAYVTHHSLSAWIGGICLKREIRKNDNLKIALKQAQKYEICSYCNIMVRQGDCPYCDKIYSIYQDSPVESEKISSVKCKICDKHHINKVSPIVCAKCIPKCKGCGKKFIPKVTQIRGKWLAPKCIKCFMAEKRPPKCLL